MSSPWDANAAGDDDIRALLREQLDLIQRAVAFNHAIARRFNDTGMRATDAPVDPPTPSSSLMLMLQQTPQASLSQPLLPKEDTNDSAGCRSLRSMAREELTNVGHVDWVALATDQSPHMNARLYQSNPRSDSTKMQQEPKQRRDDNSRHHPVKEIRGDPPEPDVTAFPDSESIKKSIEQAYERAEYRVEDLYMDTGPWQAVAKSVWFHNVTLIMIVASTLWLAVDTDLNHAFTIADAQWEFQVADNTVCIFFFVELIVRLNAFTDKHSALKDSWFVFDLFLVVMMVWDTWIMYVVGLFLRGHEDREGARMAQTLRVIRIFRLIRILRASKVFHSVPELLILVKGIAIALRSVSATLLVLVLVTYTFAIFFTQLLAETTVGADHFENVPMAINFLLLQVVCGFDATFITQLMSVGLLYYFVMLSFLLVGSMTIMNMLVGVLVEVVAAASEAEHEHQAVKRLKTQIHDIVMSTDEDCDGTVTREEFAAMLQNRAGMQKLHDAGVNVLALVDFADFIFRDTPELDLPDFISTVTQFRGSRDATVNDVVDLRVFLSKELVRLETNLGTTCEKILHCAAIRSAEEGADAVMPKKKDAPVPPRATLIMAERLHLPSAEAARSMPESRGPEAIHGDHRRGTPSHGSGAVPRGTPRGHHR